MAKGTSPPPLGTFSLVLTPLGQCPGAAGALTTNPGAWNTRNVSSGGSGARRPTVPGSQCRGEGPPACLAPGALSSWAAAASLSLCLCGHPAFSFPCLPGVSPIRTPAIRLGATPIVPVGLIPRSLTGLWPQRPLFPLRSSSQVLAARVCHLSGGPPPSPPPYPCPAINEAPPATPSVGDEDRKGRGPCRSGTRPDVGCPWL